MYGHRVHLRLTMLTFLKMSFFCQKHTKKLLPKFNKYEFSPVSFVCKVCTEEQNNAFTDLNKRFENMKKKI